MKQKSRRQLRADKQRALNIAKKEHELMELKAEARRLKTMKSNFSIHGTVTGRLTKQFGSIIDTERGSLLNPPVFRRTTPNYPSAKLTNADYSKLELRVLSQEMQEREKAAQEQIKHRKKQVGVLFNKGGYQLITEGMDLTTLGKK